MKGLKSDLTEVRSPANHFRPKPFPVSPKTPKRHEDYTTPEVREHRKRFVEWLEKKRPRLY